MTRGGFVFTAEAAGSIVAVDAEFGFVIAAAEHMLSGAQLEAVRPTPSMSNFTPAHRTTGGGSEGHARLSEGLPCRSVRELFSKKLDAFHGYGLI